MHLPNMQVSQRSMEQGFRMKVRVAFDTGGRHYAYEWPDVREPLVQGDVVEVPASWAFPGGGRIATVVGIGSDYDGPMAVLVRKVEPPQEVIQLSPAGVACEDCDWSMRGTEAECMTGLLSHRWARHDV